MSLEKISELTKELLAHNLNGDKELLEERTDQLLWKLEKTLYIKTELI